MASNNIHADTVLHAAEYEWATWRMYNRIVDHRQKNPLQTSYTSTSSTERTTDNEMTNRIVDSNSSRVTFEDNLEGEIFDLDL